MTESPVLIRSARGADDAALLLVDRQTQSALTSPADLGSHHDHFFADESAVADHWVAEVDDRVVGYVMLQRPSRLASHQHVRAIGGLAVAPDVQRRGVGRRLLTTLFDDVRPRGVQKVTLRVLAWNEPARRLYASCGFVTEGVLRREFALDGRYVDDVLMARWV